MKNFKKILSVLLVVVMAFSIVACNKNPQDTSSADGDKPAAEMKWPIDQKLSYDEQSAKGYEMVLGDFKKVYEDAKKIENVSQRYAAMAIAEAKLMEAAVMLPSTTQGGNYGITRVAKRSASTVLWGTDMYRFHSAIVTTELIKAEDTKHLLELWNKEKGNGTYSKKAVEYLTSKGYKFKDTYTLGYASDPITWDALATSQAPDHEAIVNTYDGLVEYNNENVLSPALAEKWEVSEDKKTFTFHLRKGVKWADAQGRDLGELTADDFVAGMQHMLDAKGGVEYLVDGLIVNAHEYMEGTVTDFSKVGVKAVDNYTVEYTLTKPTSYFETMLTYCIFAPMNRKFFESKGGAFGLDKYQAASEKDTYTYGKTANDIAYCGPYVVTNATAENTIIFELNPLYWNKDNIRNKKITWKYNDGKDKTKAYNDTKNDVIDGCGLTSAALEAAKKDGIFETYATVSDTNATSFCMFLNVNRQAYKNFNDETKVVSAMNDKQKMAAANAMLNVHFRRAVAMGLDASAYNAQVVGEELKLNALRNSFTPGNFVSLLEDVTVKIGGKDKTYKAGTYYGQIMQDQIDADGVKVKVWDSEKQTGDGFAGWYNPAAAMEELKIAMEELKKDGVEITKENPIILDLPAWTSNEGFKNRASALKKSIEASLEGLVQVNLVDCADSKEWYNAGFYTSKGSEANYTLYDVSGWAPDYGDPSTYLDTMLGEYAGYMCKCIGLY